MESVSKKIKLVDFPPLRKEKGNNVEAKKLSAQYNLPINKDINVYEDKEYVYWSEAFADMLGKDTVLFTATDGYRLAKVWEERIRVLDFLIDYDKPKNERILKTRFRRGLDLACLQLSESEMAILEDAYQSEGYPDYVDYYRFSDEVELAFTKKHLEKNPLITPVQFRSMHPTEVNKLDPDEENIFLEGMKRVAIKVRREQTPLFLFFLAFDKLHVGHVTHSQFDRILANLNLLELFTPIELLMVHKKFSKEVKKFEMIHYFDFIIQICHLAGIDP